jgi:N-acyl homoserine lactone hydrolase
MDVLRLQLGSVQVTDDPWPVHGFVILHPALGAVLVDTGCGGPDDLLREFRVVNRSVAAALADHDLSPVDVKLVINTHLHFDHCGQNAAFEHAPLYVQREELDRVKREEPDVFAWLDTGGVRFELIDTDLALADDLHVMRTPGHTVGHQSVVAVTERGSELFIGDAAYRRSVWERPDDQLLEGQAADLAAWRRSLDALRAMRPARLHFCHDTA